MSEEKEIKALKPISEMPVTMKTLESLSALPTTPERYRGKPHEMWAVVLLGRELGIGPMTSVNNLFLVNGQQSMFAKLMSALILGKGHYYVLKADPELAEITCHRFHPQTGRVVEVAHLTFSMDDAERAGLIKQNPHNWEKYPQMMLTNRVLAWAGRTVYADCTHGLAYTPDELGIDDSDVEALTVVDEIPTEDEEVEDAEQ